ncbi:VIT1/CCC1 transporter family protein [Nocardioides jejuensis]|uniref:VIT family protein n=1 Tax=Nocardioides jejuensis TaxID=2502782 RepID=A0A4R1CDR7_9ACTN|nr:VIT family protein [Nocardioides jejuensis]TCJ28931.1 VIT family protein [Nocardioides jejuensis]
MANDTTPQPPLAHPDEPHHDSTASRLNWLRAGVLGANDGLVSTAGLVIGVAAATPEPTAILTAGIAGLAAGAVSMALGEYVSVSTQRDTELALIAKEKHELKHEPEEEFLELIGLLEQRGLSPETSRKVAHELTEADPLRAHLALELGIDQEDLTNPWHAAISSAISFSLGALVPILASLIAWHRLLWIVGAVAIGLVVTGYVSAHLGDAGRRRAMSRVLVGGLIAMAITYAVGRAVGASGI